MLRQQAVVSQSVLLPESLIWTYVIQMTSALRHIHLAGLACRTLDPTKILIINKTRLLLNCCGIFDVLTFDPTSSNPMAAMAHYQQEDLIALGKIVLGETLYVVLCRAVGVKIPNLKVNFKTGGTWRWLRH